MFRFLFTFFLLLVSACTAHPSKLAHSVDNEMFFCGYEIGEIACDLSLQSQLGDPWTLHQNEGSIIVLDFSAPWCGPCIKAAREINLLTEYYQNSINFIYVTILLDGYEGNTAVLEDLQQWSWENNVNSPVLAGNRNLISPTAWNISGVPTFYIIDEDMIIVDIIEGYSKEELEKSIISAID